MDNQLQLLKRKAYAEPENNSVVWGYVRALERASGQTASSHQRNWLVPFRWYHRSIHRDSGNDDILFDDPEPINGMSLTYLPYVKPVNNPEELVELYLKFFNENHEKEQACFFEKQLGIYYDLAFQVDTLQTCQEVICGYAVVDEAVIKLSDVNYNPGRDSASDAIAAYRTAFCLENAHTVVKWRYYLDDYSDNRNSGFKPWNQEDEKASS